MVDRSSVTQRFNLILDLLKKEKRITYYYEFIENLDVSKHYLGQIRSGQAPVPINFILEAINRFNASPNFMFLEIGEPFLDRKTEIEIEKNCPPDWEAQLKRLEFLEKDNQRLEEMVKVYRFALDKQ